MSAIEEENKIIAKFMGAEWKKDNYDSYGYYSETFPSWNYWQAPAALKYHTSWDWLMPVVEKIDIVFFKEISNAQRAIYLADDNIKFWLMPLSSPIKQVWLAVIEFIRWFNNQNK